MKKLLYLHVVILILLSQWVPPVQSSSLESTPAQILTIAHGAHLRPTLEYGQEIVAFNNLVQKNLAVIMYYLDWNTTGLNGAYFDPYLVFKIRQTFGNSSPAIMLTWQPMSGKQPGCVRNYTNLTAVPLNDIIRGDCDTYIRGFARDLKARPERYLLRFAPEMNIYSSPWWPGNFNQDASAFVQMWRHVHDVFASENVPNVEWVWAPNVESAPREAWNNRNNYYPGDQYVDWVGVDGYNWYTTLSQPWMTFSDIFDSAGFNYALKDFTCRYPKPQIIAEFASVEGPGGASTKASWITDAFQKIPEFPFVRATVWFNDYAFASPSGADFRVTSGTAASQQVAQLPTNTGAWTNAYKQALSNSVYSSQLPSLQTATPPSTYCGNGEPVYQTAPSSALIDLSITQSSSHQIVGMLNTQDLALSLFVPAGSHLSGTFSPTSLPAPWGRTTLTIQATTQTPPGSYDVIVQGNGSNLITIRVTVIRTSQDRVLLPIIIRGQMMRSELSH